MRKNYKNISWILILCFIAFDKNALTLYKSTQISNLIMQAIQCIVCVIALIKLFRCRTNAHNMKASLIFILYFAIIFFANYVSVIIYKTDVNTFLSQSLLIGCALTVVLYCVFYEDKAALMKDINIASSFLLILGFIYYFIFPEYVIYKEAFHVFRFKGLSVNRNGYIEIALVNIVTNIYLLMKTKKYRFFYFIMILLATVTVFTTGSATSLVTLLVFYSLLFIVLALKQEIPIKFICITYLCFFVFLMIFNNSNVIAVIAHMLGKRPTLTDRTILWEFSLKQIWLHPIIGYGLDNQLIASAKLIPAHSGMYINDSHNGILFILLTGGIVSLMAMIFVVAKVFKRYVKYKNDILMSLLMCFIVAWFVRGLSESCLHYSNTIFWAFLAIMMSYVPEGKTICNTDNSIKGF